MQSKSSSSPIKIIFLGGALATITYLIWNNYGAFIKNRFGLIEKPRKNIVVRDILKSSYKNTSKSSAKKNLVSKNEEEIFIDEDFNISPITNDQRQELIKKAREAIESRLDPFGQEVVLPPSSISQKNSKPLPPPEVELDRKQVELVGVISSQEKDLALINVYTASFTLPIEATEEDIENEMKKFFAKAVPNRIEVYVLDPVEDWFVKSISRSKARSQEPSIDLVKGNRKFTLKVGQKILLPPEVSFDEQAAVIRAKMEDEEKIKKELGLL